MAYNSHHLLLLSILAIVCLFANLPSTALGVGAGEKIDPKGPEAIGIAKFAIDEHNKEAKTKLQFESVVKADKQVGEGIYYRVGFNALDGTTSRAYEAIVLVKPRLKFKKLISFNTISNQIRRM
ncbi:hypothetical protein ACH5RR_017485 [Cinchona calisaya]|uniref:Cystatin domain-containing protein n=1 Tax=Cinchona calisaya TaxID=153742 RepID=A0ABD2ZIN6_9GENT